MQEYTLALVIADALGFDTAQLLSWNQSGNKGSLGLEVCEIMKHTATGPKDDLSLEEIDAFLDELAAKSGFSAEHVREKQADKEHRKRVHVVRDVFGKLEPEAAGFLTEIILKDLKPILYRVPEGTNTVDALRKYNTKSFSELTKEQAMLAWDKGGQMLRHYKRQATIDQACKAWEEGTMVEEPTLHVPIAIPKSTKGLNASHAIGCYDKSVRTLYAETKYDGERAQIHLEYIPGDEPRITIFSKSQRNSTLDRTGVHSIARSAVFGPKSPGRVRRNVILDAEMVAYDKVENRIDEFWRIRSLVAATAEGPRKKHRHTSATEDSDTSSLTSIEHDDDERHLALVFFDVLYLDDRSLLECRYSERRRILETILRVEEGQCMLSKQCAIDTRNRCAAEAELNRLCAQTFAEFEEGLMLKADNGRYNQFSSPWTKMKRDYIPGVGDTVDVVLLGAGWSKGRASGLHVTTEVLTTLYLGVVTNMDEVKRNPDIRPHFDIYFTAEYGPALTREALEHLNFWISSADHVKQKELSTEAGRQKLPYDFTLYSALVLPRLLLEVPLLAEVYGAGFTVSPKNRRYELRFPRLSKLYRGKERDWTYAVTAQELHEIARKACGRDPSKARYARQAAALFRSSTIHKSVRCLDNAAERAKDFIQRLAGRKTSLKRSRDKDDSDSIPSPCKRTKKASIPLKGTNCARSLSLLTPRPSPAPKPLPMSKSEPALLVRSTLQDEFKRKTMWHMCHSVTRAGSRSWKARLSPFNHIHDLDGLLQGCGWIGDAKSPWCERGLIVVDAENRAAVESHLEKAGSRISVSRVPIWVVEVDVPFDENLESHAHVFE
ncbi:hypothetical protein BDZ89DRAFT_1155460 [Hymenopellis radicata]|nr:hypothetical protein BDZ89DRAFT_1155460 [Hymenopellis radicata]